MTTKSNGLDGATPKHPVKEVSAGDGTLFGKYSGNDVRIENTK